MNLFELADQYCRESNWKTLAMLKFCLLSIGGMIGMFIPDSWRGVVLVIFGILFIVTYIPLMTKLFRIWKNSRK